MKRIQYKVIFANGDSEIVVVRARDLNSGFGKALKLAKEPLGSGYVRELHSIEFWSVV